jgi:glutathione S-transferase
LVHLQALTREKFASHSPKKGIPFQLITEVPWNRDTITPQYNPLEKIPILLCPDGTSICESRFILEWLELKHPVPPLTPHDVDDLLRVKRFEVLADGVADALVLIFWERAREPAQQSREWAERQQRKVDGGIREIARLLGGAEHCAGGMFTVADIAVGSLLGWMQLRFPEHGWREVYANLAALARRLEQRSSFRDSVPTAQIIRDKVA